MKHLPVARPFLPRVAGPDRGLSRLEAPARRRLTGEG